MSPSVLTSPSDLDAPPGDFQFPLGYRLVRDESSDDPDARIQVPLTMEDILHPQEEDRPVVSQQHVQDLYYLFGTFQVRTADDPTALVLSDVRVTWDPTGEVAYGPDAIVFRGVRERPAYLSTFNVALMGGDAKFIVEVTSPETRSTDLERKVEHYARLGVPLYVIADRGTRPGIDPFRLLAYRLIDDEYVSQPSSAEGRYWLDDVGLWIGPDGDRVSCWTADGKRVLGYAETFQVAEAAETARLALEARVRQLEALLRDPPHGPNGASANGS